MEKYEQNQETKCITMAGQQYIEKCLIDGKFMENSNRERSIKADNDKLIEQNQAPLTVLDCDDRSE